MGREGHRISATEAASTLGWWLEAGVDGAVAERPRNWLERKTEPSNVREPSPQAVSQALETLHLFRDWLGTAPSLPLGGPGARRVLPQGQEAAPVMLIAEMPGQEDAAEGKPIGGEAWLLMTRMLAAIDIRAEDAYSASLSCFHAPGAKMDAGELAECADIARQHIVLAKPKRLLLLGDAPARALLGKSLAAARGHVHKIEGVRAVATFHPRTLMNQPSNKALAWRDLLLLMEEEP
ncbi:MAG TPA: uracil-DNA glycosylase [Sphingomicrobium sp.]|nr:uracil-DNA glycosylase [Sphingomicrobium sp.]